MHAHDVPHLHVHVLRLSRWAEGSDQALGLRQGPAVGVRIEAERQEGFGARPPELLSVALINTRLRTAAARHLSV